MPLQQKILLDPARFKVVRCGRRWGKTVAGTVASLVGHGPLDANGVRLRRGALQGGTVWWIAPVLRQANKYWAYVKERIDGAWINKNEVHREITLYGGGMIAVRSADQPDTLRGEGLDGVVMDEGAFMRQQIWSQSVRPMLSDKQGWALFPTTPNGFNWFKELCDTNAKLPNWAFWHMPSWTNPLIPKSEFSEVREEIGELDYRQEYGAEFVREAESEFGEYLDDHIWFDGQPPADCYARLIAVDPSKGASDKSDYTAIVAGYFDPRGYVWIDAEIDRMPAGMITNRSLAWCIATNNHGIAFETNAFQELIGDEFRRRAHALNVRTRVDGINNTDKKRLRIRKSLSTWLEFGRLKFRRSRGGMMLVEQLREFPIGDHDDGPDALEMLIRYHDQVRGFIGAN